MEKIFKHICCFINEIVGGKMNISNDLKKIDCDGMLKSSKFLLTIIQKEYDYELNRYESLINRTGIIFTLYSAILLFFIRDFKIDKICKYFWQNKKITCSDVIGISITLLIVVLILKEIICICILIYKIFSIKLNYRLGYECYDIKNQRNSNEIVSSGLISGYKKILKTLAENNDNIAEYYMKVLMKIIILIFLLCINNLIIQIIF